MAAAVIADGIEIGQDSLRYKRRQDGKCSRKVVAFGKCQHCGDLDSGE